MLAASIVLCAAAAAVIWQLPRLSRQRQWKEAAVYLIMLAAGAFLSVVAVTVQKTPSPLLLIEIIYGPINQLLKNWFS
ncbi:hypothetical protein BC351_12235 [Paenibacillus ferrarius]|uniref:Uncharacterized protein n=1 Tax=Paenibacillus ferrarius TaxID=1469647 RepID=A0A1V4H7Y4_9BACL|nr:hypothetical protein [Paenibacillus ferrarius]OPH47261.1 hypothetical protein BC351_12235 [Paenibacillus ferrarius]